MTVRLSCPKCRADVAADIETARCHACHHKLEFILFPAYQRAPETGRAAQAVVTADDAGCFYHPASRAEVSCEACGRFLCALCDVEVQGEHLCPNCLNSGTKKKRIQKLEHSRLMWGGIAAMIAILPLLAFWPLSIVTGPLAIFLAIFGWRKPRSLVRTGYASFLAAILLGLVQTIAWGWFLTAIFIL